MPYLLQDASREQDGAAGAPTEPGDEEGAAWEERAAASVERLREAIQACNRRIAPLVEKEGSHVNQYWGYISRAGWADKSHLMRQIEKYADIYTSRVSNLLPYSPYMRFTVSPQSLAHEQPQKHWAINAADDASFERAAGARAPTYDSTPPSTSASPSTSPSTSTSTSSSEGEGEGEGARTLRDEDVRSSDVYNLIYKEDRRKYEEEADLVVSDWDANANTDMWSDPNTPSDKKRSGPQTLG